VTAYIRNMQHVFGAMELVTVDITSQALYVNAVWPLFTMPHFDVATHHFLDATGAKFMEFSPVISESTRGEWESYAVANRTDEITPGIHDFRGPIPQGELGPFIPVWQINPEPSSNVVFNFDLLSFPVFSQAYIQVEQGKQRTMSGVANFESAPQFPGSDELTEPHSFLIEPVFDEFMGDPNLIGVLSTLLPLDFFLRDILHVGSERIFAIIRDSCGKNYTYAIFGPDTEYLGEGDLHDKSFNDLKVSISITANIRTDVESIPCELTMDLYPSEVMQDSHRTSNSWIYTGIIIAIFLGSLTVFLMYERYAQRRIKTEMASASTTMSILATLFPSSVHERLFSSGKDSKARHDLANDENDSVNKAGGRSNKASDAPHLKKLTAEERNYSDVTGHGEVVNGMYTTKPIADFFPDATIMFAEIMGFATWSSNREPTQVFILLETIFRAFDVYAKRRDVFKVETIGDCYVAVTGLPHARSDHAVVMVKFAKDCMNKMAKLARPLAVSLGPETRDLKLRVGIHSGPVIAGVLRGEKSRFQLFGDSMNTTARIETSGVGGSIHLSPATAELLISAGHSNWLLPRRDLVTAKGKGVMRTYWLQLGDLSDSAHASLSQHTSLSRVSSYDSISNSFGGDFDSDFESDDEDSFGAQLSDTRLMSIDQKSGIPEKSPDFLVEWSVGVMLGLLKQVIAKREEAESISKKSGSDLEIYFTPKPKQSSSDLEIYFSPEVSEDGTKSVEEIDASEVAVDPVVEAELRAYVLMISAMYRDHGFHNFEHASHVMRSITKLMMRIAAPSLDAPPESTGSGDLTTEINGMLHNCCYGVASDPLLIFAVAFAALIHDVDHAGVPNTRLVKEDVNLAIKYRFKSVAEKNSIRLAWERLMGAEFRELRSCLCPTQLELKRFRNLVVNAVMATDLADKELNDKRNERWSQCFDDWPENPSEDDMKRKSTIIIEHLIQTADIAHTTQNFEVFKKWNERLFYERFTAFDSSRADEDPSTTWYEDELKFFDFFVIPLAQKLGSCGVSGLESLLELLSYAQDNRKKWVVEGSDMVKNWRLQYYAKKLENNASPGGKR
jgi:class 3 adenylate cyclase